PLTASSIADNLFIEGRPGVPPGPCAGGGRGCGTSCVDFFQQEGAPWQAKMVANSGGYQMKPGANPKYLPMTTSPDSHDLVIDWPRAVVTGMATQGGQTPAASPQGQRGQQGAPRGGVLNRPGTREHREKAQKTRPRSRRPVPIDTRLYQGTPRYERTRFGDGLAV
ncbi:MAG: hypothetical protein QGI09_09285, partial [Dehalococcoidia bacterium]|nr:hypothetical protein [Dehalococcoidia bacterium]